jgi:transcription elongation factor Elf1
MMTIASVGVDHYRIPLPVVLSDSTHGDIAEFELVTVRVRDAAGTEGLGYTYTVGRGGTAVAASGGSPRASLRRARSMRSELEWVIQIPVPCPHCGKESTETIARLIHSNEIICGHCRGRIDLTSNEWRAYLKEFTDAIGKVRPIYDKLP